MTVNGGMVQSQMAARELSLVEKGASGCRQSISKRCRISFANRLAPAPAQGQQDWQRFHIMHDAELTYLTVRLGISL